MSDPTREALTYFVRTAKSQNWHRSGIPRLNKAVTQAEAALSTTPAPDPECDCEPQHVWPCATIGRCDEPGCDREATCGWATRPGGTGPNGGYRRTCGPHMRSTP